MKNRFITLANSLENAVTTWKNSQFDIADIVLSLTDNKCGKAGTHLYSVFRNEEFLKMMYMYTCNFQLIKEVLGINGEYVERAGDPYAKNFNPKRNPEVLTLDAKQMDERAWEIYQHLIDEVNYIAKNSHKNNYV